ncbi:MAG: hypothetical protein IPO32_14120 [Crocinitomicaceae bacterium]|nr:hypothetical protein [Crocinitomicaceae bacterium]
MKFSGALLCTILNFNCNSQVNFFINPNLNFKAATAFVDPANQYFNHENNIFENQYFYPPYSVANSSRIVKHPAFAFGLGVGIRYKNDRRIIQVSWNKDVANFRAQSFFRPYYSPEHGAFDASYLGVKLQRFTLSYAFKISQKESLMQTWFSIGIGSFINDGYNEYFPFFWDIPLAPNGDRLLSTYLQPYREKKINGLLKIGFENDLYLKKKYWLSINAFYIQGFGNISRVEYVHEYLINNEQFFSRTGLMSRGSGFYIEFSRRLNVYPWGKKKN